MTLEQLKRYCEYSTICSSISDTYKDAQANNSPAHHDDLIFRISPGWDPVRLWG